MKALPSGCVDAVITDPPYGIGLAANPFRQRFAKASWDDVPCSDEQLAEIRRVGKEQIIWGGNYFRLPPSQGFLIWDKGQSEHFSSAMVEFAWRSRQSPAKMFYRFVVTYEKEHPTQKPEDLMLWCVRQESDADTILDPFCGSGTTLVAAKKLGRHFLGFEISEEYCAIARRRLAEIDAQPQLPFVKPEQMTL